MGRKHSRGPAKQRWPHAWLTLGIDGCFAVWIGLFAGAVGPCGGPEQPCNNDARYMILGLVVLPFALGFVGFNIAMLIDWILFRCCRPVPAPVTGSVSTRLVYPPPPQWVRDTADPRLWRWWDGRQYTHPVAERELPQG